MFAARLLESSADKRRDHRVPVTAPEPAPPCPYEAPAFITQQAGFTAYLLPFDTDMWCSLVTDAARRWSQRSQMTFWIVFFFSPSVATHYLFNDGRQCNPGHPHGAGGCCCLSSEITFTSNESRLCVHERPSRRPFAQAWS